jgi:hypothetical protein
MNFEAVVGSFGKDRTTFEADCGPTTLNHESVAAIVQS